MRVSVSRTRRNGRPEPAFDRHRPQAARRVGRSSSIPEKICRIVKVRESVRRRGDTTRQGMLRTAFGFPGLEEAKAARAIYHALVRDAGRRSEAVSCVIRRRTRDRFRHATAVPADARGGRHATGGFHPFARALTRERRMMSDQARLPSRASLRSGTRTSSACPRISASASARLDTHGPDPGSGWRAVSRSASTDTMPMNDAPIR